MTKREVLEAMIAKMDEFETDPAKSTAKTALDIHNLHQQYITSALQIATDNGYADGVKWQLWEQVCKHYEQKLMG